MNNVGCGLPQRCLGPDAGPYGRAARCAGFVLALLIPGSFVLLGVLWLWRHRDKLKAHVQVLSLKLSSVLLFCVLALSLGGCSVRQLAVDRLSDAIAQSGTAFAGDDDPELVRAAVPFSLKLMDSLLAESPSHKGLLLAAAKGFTQYTYAFVQQEADEIEDRDLARALVLRSRARKLYTRARDYGLRGLGAGRPGFAHDFATTARPALATIPAQEAGLLYWTAASWAALIALSKDSPAVLGEIPFVEALIDRALELDETYDNGAIHTFLIAYEMVRQGKPGDPAVRARTHFHRAQELAAGTDISPIVALAESVCVPTQQRAEFAALLDQALAFDPNRAMGNRLANIVMQRRARQLLARIDELFAE